MEIQKQILQKLQAILNQVSKAPDKQSESLQRLREQFRAWAEDPSIRDCSTLLEMRRLVEAQMVTFFFSFAILTHFWKEFSMSLWHFQ